MSRGLNEAKAQVELVDFPNIFSLKGKVAVVSGGSRGLGLNAASGLLQYGCAKVFITSRKAVACQEACDALNALPNKAPGAVAIPIAADSSKVSEILRLVEEVKKHTDHVDILFANAGASWGAKFEDHTDDSWDKVMNLNVKSVFFTIQKYVRPFASISLERMLIIFVSDSLHFYRKTQQEKIQQKSSSQAQSQALA